jgi:hypothetical protein
VSKFPQLKVLRDMTDAKPSLHSSEGYGQSALAVRGGEISRY